MKALSIHQPWASKIESGDKTIETRTWSTNYRGEILIVSARRHCTEWPKLPLGQALCLAMIIDCHRMTRADEVAACCSLYEGAYAWVLKHIQPIRHFPVAGRQGLYNVELPHSIAKARQLYEYTWGNNSKRQTLQGRTCRLLAHGKMNTRMVEFTDNGQQEIIDGRALRKSK